MNVCRGGILKKKTQFVNRFLMRERGTETTKTGIKKNSGKVNGYET